MDGADAREVAAADDDGFATGISRVGAAIGTWGAPVVLAHSTRLAMLLGAVIRAIGWAASYVLAPETSGLTLADASAADRDDDPRGRSRLRRESAADPTTPRPAVKETS